MQAIQTNEIHITDPYVKRAQERLVAYLLSLDAKHFLYEIYKVAELEPLTTEGYGGWERSDAINFRGHFFGHFLSASALAYQAEKKASPKAQLLASLKTAVAGLATAQKHYAQRYPASAGYISAFREAALDEVEGKAVTPAEKENVLVPWYNLHKILAGLLDVHEYLAEADETLSQQALQVATQFGDYIYRRMVQLPDKKQMLTIEYGGMNDALYRLYEITQQTEHQLAATYFDEDELIEQLALNQDVLAGKHANTMIPKLIGALNRYRVLQNQPAKLSKEVQATLEQSFQAAKNFWDITVNTHTYCTGGNSQSEHFHEPNELYFDAELRNGDCTCETCNTHNMLKLTRNLYFLTKEKKYLDYYEQTYINAILASQNPETGMMMYFQPMGAGYNKVYNRPYDEFWCCTGTGIESFAKLADTFYLEEDQTIFVNSYFSNTLQRVKENLILTHEMDRAKFRAKLTFSKLNPLEESRSIALALRLPTWSSQTTIAINGAEIDFTEKAGFAYLPTRLNLTDSIEIEFSPQLTFVATADNPAYVALTYGPYVLAGGFDKTDVDADNPNGILVRVGTKDPLLADSLTVTDPNWQANLSQSLEAIEVPDKLCAFKLNGAEEKIIFTPYYEMHGERYGIYFKVRMKDSVEAKQAQEEKEALLKQQAQIYQELHHFDENNSEYAKNLSYQHSFVGDFHGKRYRIAEADGWFQYEFSLQPVEETLRLALVFHTADYGKTINVQIGEETYQIEVPHSPTSTFITKELLISSRHVFDGKLQLKFASQAQSSARLFGIQLLKLEK